MSKPPILESNVEVQEEIIELLSDGRTYTEGFYTEIESDTFAKGLNEEVIRRIAEKKNEPDWMLEWRLKSLRAWQKMNEPKWAHLQYNSLDYQQYSYYSAPSCASCEDANHSVEDLDEKIADTFHRLGVPLNEESNLAVDAIFDSVSVATSHKKQLEDIGVIFCSFSEAVQKHPEIIQKYMGTVVPYDDNFFATLNSAVASDGTLVYIPPNVRCPVEISTYFRMNEAKTGQFERTLLIADKGSYVSYIEGCSAPARDDYQLHAAVVEVIALEDAEVKYSTVQNWYPGDENSEGGILNFVTKRGICLGKGSKISWTQAETGSAITWKYPSVILKGDNSVAEFYSVALTSHSQQADTGTKMIHLGKNTKSTIISKGISAGKSQNSYRGLVKVGRKADNARNYTQCDSMLIGSRCGAHTFPYIECSNNSAQLEHEATTSKIGDDQLYYCAQRGINEEDAVSMIVNGFCKEVLTELPLEFAEEAKKLLEISLEGSVG